jgi:flagellar basal-body rod protein FlgF
MTDRAIYLGMAGAKDAMFQLNIVSNNLANANTIGFRADYATIKPKSIKEDGGESRQSTDVAGTYCDFKTGAHITTGRSLDVAIEDKGFIAVLGKDNQEAYTRNGNLHIDAEGRLVTSKNEVVLGEGGPIIIPRSERVSIGKHGAISALISGTSDKDIVNLDRIKLVEAPIDRLQKGRDGLFYIVGDGTAAVSDKVRLIPEALEGSNVDTVKSMVDLIDISRSFEMHSRLIKTIEDKAMRSNQLLDITA